MEIVLISCFSIFGDCVSYSTAKHESNACSKILCLSCAQQHAKGQQSPSLDPWAVISGPKDACHKGFAKSGFACLLCVQPRVQEVSFPSLPLSTGVSMGWSTNYTEPDLLYLRCRDKHICLTGRWWSHSGNYQQFSMTRSSVGFGEWGARNSEQQTEFSWQKAQKPQWGPGTVSHKVCILQILVIEPCDFVFTHYSQLIFWFFFLIASPSRHRLQGSLGKVTSFISKDLSQWVYVTSCEGTTG